MQWIFFITRFWTYLCQRVVRLRSHHTCSVNDTIQQATRPDIFHINYKLLIATYSPTMPIVAHLLRFLFFSRKKKQFSIDASQWLPTWIVLAPLCAVWAFVVFNKSSQSEIISFGFIHSFTFCWVIACCHNYGHRMPVLRQGLFVLCGWRICSNEMRSSFSSWMHRIHVNTRCKCSSKSQMATLWTHFYRCGKCVVSVCNQSLKCDRLETWRTVVTKFYKDIGRLKAVFEIVNQQNLEASDEDIRASAVSNAYRPLVALILIDVRLYLLLIESMVWCQSGHHYIHTQTWRTLLTRIHEADVERSDRVWEFARKTTSE